MKAGRDGVRSPGRDPSCAAGPIRNSRRYSRFRSAAFSPRSCSPNAEPVGEERGVIINTASVAAYERQIGQIAYSAAKVAWSASRCLQRATSPAPVATTAQRGKILTLPENSNSGWPKNGEHFNPTAERTQDWIKLGATSGGRAFSWYADRWRCRPHFQRG